MRSLISLCFLTFPIVFPKIAGNSRGVASSGVAGSVSAVLVEVSSFFGVSQVFYYFIVFYFIIIFILLFHV